MLIINQNKDKLINFNTMKCLYTTQDGTVLASDGGDRIIELGNYKFELRAKQVVEKIAENEGATNLFRMPEE